MPRLMKITFVKTYVFDAEEQQNSEKKSTLIVNKFISTIKTNWIYVLKRVFNSHLINNCRKHKMLSYGDWWIMHLHHIGLPPATNINSILLVSGNLLIKTKLL